MNISNLGLKDVSSKETYTIILEIVAEKLIRDLEDMLKPVETYKNSLLNKTIYEHKKNRIKTDILNFDKSSTQKEDLTFLKSIEDEKHLILNYFDHILEKSQMKVAQWNDKNQENIFHGTNGYQKIIQMNDCNAKLNFPLSSIGSINKLTDDCSINNAKKR